MKQTFIIVIVLFTLTIACDKDRDKSSFFDSYNIVWDSESENSSESMPITGGDIGCNLWVENGDILLYMSRSGSLDENGSYLKLGRFRITLSPNPFKDPSFFRQELILKDGLVEIEGTKNDAGISQDVKLKIWVDVYNPVVHIDIESHKPVEVVAAYESWRTEDRELKRIDVDGKVAVNLNRERFSCFHLEGYPGQVIRRKDEVLPEKDGILFYHRNQKEKLIPDVLIKQQGLEESADKITDDIKNRTFGGLLFGDGFVFSGNGKGVYAVTPYRSWKMKSENPKKNHKLCIATHIEQAESLDKWKDKLFDLVSRTTENHDKNLDETISWWNKFWDRSWISVFPDKPDPNNAVWQMGRNYQLFRYQLGGNVFGEYPTKFNGGNLTFDPVYITYVNKKFVYDPDWRAWSGHVFTAQNQRLVYWPMLKSGDFDAILPQFELYRKGLPGATERVKTHFGHKGAVYCEYTSVPGIALGTGWGWENASYLKRKRGSDVPFGNTNINGLAGYNVDAEKGVMANPHIAYHWESQLEHAYMIMEYHRFTCADISKYMPFIKSALIFFDEHYQARQKMRNGKALDENGKLVLYPSTACESYRGAKNPSDLIAGLNACLQSLLTLENKYLTSEEKIYYREFLNRIPEYSFGEVDGDTIIKPAWEWLKESNYELPQFYPLFPFNQFQIGDKEIQIFKNTYRHAPEKRKGAVKSWRQNGIFFARMGMAQEAADFNTRKLQDSERRFPSFWGPGNDWVPDHNWGGSGMIGLQEMLMQSVGDSIVLFPAWPKEWDVDFKLHAPKETTVEVQLRNGKIIKLEVHPESRKKDISSNIPN